MNTKEFEKIIGYSSIKKELEQIADILRNKEAYEKLGVSAPRGLLIQGEPGVGKTLMADCTIKASSRNCFICRKNQPDGDFVKYINEIFNKAAENAPSIVFLDDMDKFANGDEDHKDSEEYVTVQSCIDDVKDKEVFVIATANNLQNLPESLLREGRFDRKIEVKAPSGQDAVEIINHYLQGKSFTVDIDAKYIARILPGRSCATLETVINEAGLYAGFERSDKITMDHFMQACMRTVFDVPVNSRDDIEEDWYSDLNDGSKETSQIIYHEAGHAVISEVLCPDSVSLVSAHGKVGRYGGFTSYYDDGKMIPYKWYISRIISTLGGMAAIDQKFGTIDIGNSKDLTNAFSMVESLITNNAICGLTIYRTKYHQSNELLSRQEQAAAIEVERYYHKAKEIISLNMEFLDKIAIELSKKKLLNIADIQRIKAECNIIPVSI